MSETKARPRAVVVIPTYNEADTIEPLVRRVLEAAPHADILVVDDSSPDGTGRIVKKIELEESRVQLFERQSKDGLAAAYLAGFEWALDRGYDRIVQMDADLSHDPADVPRLLQGLDTHDVAVGCRYIDGGRISGWGVVRKLISRGGNWYARTVLRVPLWDLTGGFNAWSRKALEAVLKPAVRSRGYAYQVELKHRAYRKGMRLLEIPIHFRNREKGYSKMTGGIVWEAALRVLEMRRA